MLAQLECPRGQTQALHRQRLVLVLLALVLYCHRLVLVLLAVPPTPAARPAAARPAAAAAARPGQLTASKVALFWPAALRCASRAVQLCGPNGTANG